MGINLAGTFTSFRLLINPSLAVPHYTISTFDQVPKLLENINNKRKQDNVNEIKGLIIDKDNCFAKDGEYDVYDKYKKAWLELKERFPNGHMIIVSNSAGSDDDKINKITKKDEATIVEENTGVKVLRHDIKKPLCFDQGMKYFIENTKDIRKPEQVAVIGDRVLTDVLMAKLNGSCAIWVSDGVKVSNSFLTTFERWLVRIQTK